MCFDTAGDLEIVILLLERGTVFSFYNFNYLPIEFLVPNICGNTLLVGWLCIPHLFNNCNENNEIF